jgi:ABC-2 type transport system ATP-binding protein
MVLEGTVPELAQKVLGGAYRIHVEAPGGNLTERFSRLEGIVRVHNGEEGRYVLEASRDIRADVATAVVAASGQLLSMHFEHPSLDEVYTQYFQEVANES